MHLLCPWQLIQTVNLVLSFAPSRHVNSLWTLETIVKWCACSLLAGPVNDNSQSGTYESHFESSVPPNGSVGWHCRFSQVVPPLPLRPSPLCSYWACSTPQRWKMRAEAGGLGQVPSSSSCGRSWLFSPFCTHSLSSDWHGSGGKLSKRHVQIRPNSVPVHLLFEIHFSGYGFNIRQIPSEHTRSFIIDW